jgi:probable rRNA maturation factor
MPSPSVGHLNLQVQAAVQSPDIPSRKQIRQWIRALGSGDGEITVRFVDTQEGCELNQAWRGKAYATNVLSFPYETRPVLMGDLVLCWPVVQREALEQGKTVEAHCAHLVIHGLLHLCGHDHEDETQAAEMEGIEQDAMTKLGYPDPYR